MAGFMVGANASKYPPALWELILRGDQGEGGIHGGQH